MKLYKTLYLNTEKVDFPVEETVLFDDATILAYASLIPMLTGVFWKAAFEYQQKVRAHAKHIRILIPSNHSNGFKSQPHFKNTTLDTLEWFLLNLVEPPGGLIISIYFYDNLYPGINNPFWAWSIWPLKQRWVGDGDYVTVNKITKFKNGANGTDKKIQNAINLGHLDLIENLEKLSPYPVKEIGYGNEEESVELLRHSKRHFAYFGSTYFLAPLVDVPTVAYGMQSNKEPWRGSIYDMKTEFKDMKYEKKAIEFEKGAYNNAFGSMGAGAARVFHFDLKSNLCIQKPQTYVRHAWDKEELLGYITFSKDLEILHRDRQDWLDLTDLPLF